MLRKKILEWIGRITMPDVEEKEAFEQYILERNIRGMYWMLPFVAGICVVMLAANEYTYRNSDTISLVSHQQYQMIDVSLLCGYIFMFLLFLHYKRDAVRNIKQIRLIQYFCYAFVMVWSICVIMLDYKWAHSINTTLFVLVGFVLSFVYHAELKTIFFITMPNIVLLCYFITLKEAARNYIFYFLVEQILLLVMFINNYHARRKEFTQQEKIKKKNEELLSINNQLMLLRKEGEEISRKKSQFLNSISHQLRTPLNGIMGTAELLSLKHLDRDTKEAVDTIQLAGSNLLSTINEFSNFNKLDTSKFAVNIVSYDLYDWIQMLRKTGEEKSKEKGIAFYLDVTGDADIQLYGDRDRLSQVAMSLITNAISFTEKGYVAVIIEVEQENGRAKLGMKVLDTGIGMSKERIGPFLNPVGYNKMAGEDEGQVEDICMEYIISKEIIHGMDGHIDFDTEEGKGSAFFFYVFQETIQKEQKTYLRGGSYEGKKILIADNNAISMIIIKNILASFKAEVDYASDVDMCREYLKYKKYDLIFMEQNFFTKKDRELERLVKIQACKGIIQVPIILFLSGGEKITLQGLKVSYLEKPVKAEQFRAMLHTYLEEEKACARM